MSSSYKLLANLVSILFDMNYETTTACSSQLRSTELVAYLPIIPTSSNLHRSASGLILTLDYPSQNFGYPKRNWTENSLMATQHQKESKAILLNDLQSHYIIIIIICYRYIFSSSFFFSLFLFNFRVLFSFFIKSPHDHSVICGYCQ